MSDHNCLRVFYDRNYRPRFSKTVAGRNYLEYESPDVRNKYPGFAAEIYRIFGNYLGLNLSVVEIEPNFDWMNASSVLSSIDLSGDDATLDNIRLNDFRFVLPPTWMHTTAYVTFVSKQIPQLGIDFNILSAFSPPVWFACGLAFTMVYLVIVMFGSKPEDNYIGNYSIRLDSRYSIWLALLDVAFQLHFNKRAKYKRSRRLSLLCLCWSAIMFFLTRAYKSFLPSTFTRSPNYFDENFGSPAALARSVTSNNMQLGIYSKNLKSFKLIQQLAPQLSSLTSEHQLPQFSGSTQTAVNFLHTDYKSILFPVFKDFFIFDKTFEKLTATHFMVPLTKMPVAMMSFMYPRHLLKQLLPLNQLQCRLKETGIYEALMKKYEMDDHETLAVDLTGRTLSTIPLSQRIYIVFLRYISVTTLVAVAVLCFETIVKASMSKKVQQKRHPNSRWAAGGSFVHFEEIY